MKIALVILHAETRRGGAERYTIDLAASLATRGHQVSLLAKDFAENVHGVAKIALESSAATRVGRYVKFLDALDAHFASASYDVVHAMLPVRQCDVYHPHAGLAADAVATGHMKHSGATRVLSALANRVNRRRQRFAATERRLLDSARPPVVLCLSDYVKETVRKYYTLPQEKLATLFNAVDLTKFDPNRRADAGRELRTTLGIAPDKIVALIIAQDFRRKGLREAILALPLARDPRLTLLVVGHESVEPFRRIADQAGVSDRVIFAGRTDDPYSFYRAADFFVLPTRHDPCSLVVLESLAMGVPVISTRFNGACEIMTNGTHGFVLDDPKNIEFLGQAMSQTCDDLRRKEMARACLELRSRLSFDEHVDRLLAIYDPIAKIRRDHRGSILKG